MPEITDPTETTADDGSVDPRRWQVLNSAVMPLWVAMILAPRSRATKWLMDRSGWWFAGYSAAYVVQLVQTATTSGPPEFGPDGLREGLSTPAGFLTGWTHFLAFDLFVGAWIVRTAR